MYATLQTPGGAVRAPLVPCASMLKLAAKSSDFRAGTSLFRRDRATSVGGGHGCKLKILVLVFDPRL